MLIIISLLLSSFARRPPPGGSAGRGFGAPPPPPRPASKKSTKQPAPAAAATSSLDRKLAEQHAENCEASASRWATCGEVPGAYASGWHAYPTASVSPKNKPYNTDRLLLKSREPLLSAADCAALIAQMEAHGAANGFDARYPVTGFTREVNIADIPESVALLNDALRTTLLPAAASEFAGACQPSSLRVNEALVVKYDASTGNNCLPVHQDFSFLTVNVALSESSEYTGGGTWFEHSGETLLAERGEAVMHAGGLRHCGVPVASGSRYQLVLFLLSADYPDVAGRLQAIGAAAGAKASQGALMDVPLSTKALERAAKLNPCDGETWSLLGYNRRHDTDLEGAATAFQKAVDVSGARDFGALTALAATRSAQERPADALAALRQALEVGAPPSPSQAAETQEAQHNAGLQLLAMGEAEAAGLVFEGVIEADADAADSWAALGLCMAELGQEAAALACQNQVLRIRAQAGTRRDERREEEDG